MSHPYDAGMKTVVDRIMPDLPPLSGRPVEGEAEVINAELSTITSGADKVVLVKGPLRWLLHLEIMTYWDALLPRRLNEYNCLLERRAGATPYCS